MAKKEDEEFLEKWAHDDYLNFVDCQYCAPCPVCGVEKKEVVFSNGHSHYIMRCHCDVQEYYRKEKGLKPKRR